METAILIWCVCGIAAAVVGSSRGANGVTLLIAGFLLGPLALLYAFGEGTECPHCDAMISKKAKVCPHCTRPIRAERSGDIVKGGIVLREGSEK